MRTRLSVRQVYKGEIEEKLLNQPVADLTKRIMPEVTKFGKYYFVLFLQKKVIFIKKTIISLKFIYLATCHNKKIHILLPVYPNLMGFIKKVG